MSEIRAAFARLRRSPGFAIGSTLSLAIGMSLGTAVFSVVDAVLLRPLPFADAERLGYFYQTIPGLGRGSGFAPARMLLAMRAEATAFSHVAAAGWHTATFGNDEQRIRLNSTAVTPNYFETLRARPLLGRLFASQDAPSLGDVVISYEFWTSRLGGDSGIVGRTITVQSESDDLDVRRVIGVLPPGFAFPGSTSAWFLLDEAKVLREASDSKSDVAWYSMIGRLKARATMGDATVQAAAIFKRLYKDDLIRKTRSAQILPIRVSIMARVAQALQLWTAAAILILILCAVNFATMSLARGMRRRGEIAVRAALGASRWDIVREIVTEAMLLAAVSGAISVLVAWWLVSFSAQLLGGNLPVEPSITWPVMFFGVGAAMIVGFVFAVAPAVELAKVDLRTVLQGNAASVTTKGREVVGQRLLVTLQLCLALTAVATVTAVIQADRYMRGFDANFDYEQLVFTDVFSRDTGAHLLGDPMMERLSAMPGVVRTAASWRVTTAIVWDNSGEAVDWPRTYVWHVTPNLFEVLGVKLLAGRLPTEDEWRDGTTFVASEALARRLAGSPQAAVGKRYRMKMGRRPRDWSTIVGVAPTLGGLESWGVNAPLYWMKKPDPGSYAQYVIAVSGSAKERARALAKALGGADPRISVRAEAAETMMARNTDATRGRYLFLAGMAALALVLAIVGVYGMTAYSTEIRLREFGIRIALGASTVRLMRAMFSDIWWMAPLGIGIGVFAAGRLTAYLDAIYRNPMMTQPLVKLHLAPTVLTAVTLVVIAAVGTALPIRRVLRLDVMRTVQGSG